jgi:hypothetical protein
MKRVLAGLLTTIVMGSMIWTALSRSPASSPSTTDSLPDTRYQDSRFQHKVELSGATACIERLVASAQAGDVASYLKAFGGLARDRFERETEEIGRDVFALRLRRAGIARQSHAIFAPEPDGNRLDRATITVESTFADRIERQTFRLERGNGDWLVTEIDTAREYRPKMPLGSLATYDEPEGPPVVAGPDRPFGDEIKN